MTQNTKRKILLKSPQHKRVASYYQDPEGDRPPLLQVRVDPETPEELRRLVQAWREEAKKRGANEKQLKQINNSFVLRRLLRVAIHDASVELGLRPASDGSRGEAGHFLGSTPKK